MFLSCGKNTGGGAPTTPEPPKPKAKINVEVSEWPIDVQMWAYNNEYIFLNPKTLVTETNGVGGTVTKVQVTASIGSKVKAQETKSGGKFAAYGSVELSFSLKIYYPDYQVDKLEITVEGGDNNGYSFSKTVSYNLSW